MIPKKIHYCWFGGKPLPKDVKKCIKSWQKMCPDYEIIEWNESNFDINCCSFVKDAYTAKAWAFVSDYARLKIVYDNGGIYLDTDVELIKNIDFLLHNNCFFATQQEGGVVATGLGFGAIKGASILKEMLDCYESTRFDNEKKEEIACPILNTKVLKKYGFEFKENVIKLSPIDVTVYPPKFFDPISPGDTKNLYCDDTVSIHHYSASWTNSNNKFKRKIINMIGQDRVNKIKKIFK